MTQPDVPTATIAGTYSPISDRELAAGPTMGPVEQARPWSLAKRVGFRFALAYILLYTFPGPINELPYASAVSDGYQTLWRAAVPWIGANVLRLASPINMRPSGSGDRLYNWVQVFGELLLAVIIAIVWSAIDRKPRAHTKLYAATRLYLRFTLAAIMLGYGFDKVIPNQFEPMSPVRLTQYFGEAAPGGFAWSFLGFSVMYEVFAGAGEVLSTFLLFFRRTTTLGALVGAAVLTNVFMLNMSYDIPVKQFALHLLLMSLFLAAPDVGRLTNVLIRNTTAEPRVEVSLFTTRRSMRIATVVGLLLAAWIVIGTFWGEFRAAREFGRWAPRGPLYGIFEVDEVVKNGTVQTPLLTDATRWRRLSANSRQATVRLATDSVTRYRLQVDSVKRRLTLTVGADTANAISLAYAFPDRDHLVLRGRLAGDSVDMKLTRRSEQSYLLVSRGFHWVNETPYFR